MKTNDYLNISTLHQLRMARKALSEEINLSERNFTDRMDATLQFFRLGKMILPLIKILRTFLSGTPFANS